MDLPSCTHQQSHPPWSSWCRLWDVSGHRQELKMLCDTTSQALHSLTGSYPPLRLNLALGRHTTVQEEKTVSLHLSLGKSMYFTIFNITGFTKGTSHDQRSALVQQPRIKQSLFLHSFKGPKSKLESF